MTRNTTNFVIDGLTALIVLWLVFTGLLIYFVLPPGSGRERLMWLGLDRHGWGDVHFWTAMAALTLVLVHVALHWTWVCTTVTRVVHPGHRGSVSRAKRHLAGALAVLILVGGMVVALWLARATVQRNESPPRRRRAEPIGAIDRDAFAPSRIAGRSAEAFAVS